jgi:DNA-binding cell septation regulator SpoVG
VIRNIQFTPASDREAQRGLLAYVQLEYGLLLLDGVTLRRTTEGGLTLSWPERRDRHGRRHTLLRPIDDKARLDIEAAVLAELRRQEASR